MRLPFQVCFLSILIPVYMFSQTNSTTPLVVAPQAQTFHETVLHSFSAYPDGAVPYGPLIMDAAHNLYGTTQDGGTFSELNYGTVFKLDANGTETILYSFQGIPDAVYPESGLIFDAAGNLYGTGAHGGSQNHGAVFELDPAGNEVVLHSFTGTDGDTLRSGLFRDKAGNLYGTTFNNGASGKGTIYRLNAAGTETGLYSFAGAPDGAHPIAGLIRDPEGNFYGTTYAGGTSNYGSIYEVTNKGKEIVLYSFDSFAFPTASLIRDRDGNLYGTTYLGGPLGTGTIYKLDTNDQLTVLYTFLFNGMDGYYPYGTMIMDAAGNFYGTTSAGGIYGKGTVYKLDTSGVETVLYNFAGAPNDGANPWSGLIGDSEGNLYGTTLSGGSTMNQSNCPQGCGVVFELSRD
jgi:uncharacterized repeat protein (TIGR03803 family)